MARLPLMMNEHATGFAYDANNEHDLNACTLIHIQVKDGLLNHVWNERFRFIFINRKYQRRICKTVEPTSNNTLTIWLCSGIEHPGCEDIFFIPLQASTHCDTRMESSI